MAKKATGPVAPKATTGATVVPFQVQLKDGVHIASQVLPTAADIDALEKAVVSAATAKVTADRTAATRAWEAGRAAAPLYSARRASGDTDEAAYKGILQALKKGGVDKTTAGRLAACGRGLAAGVEPKPEETYKEFAARVGSPIKQGGGEKPKADTAKNRAKALEKAVTLLGDALASLRTGKASPALIAAAEKVATAAHKEAEAEKAAAAAEENAQA